MSVRSVALACALVWLAEGIISASPARAAYVSNVMRCVYRNGSGDNRWLLGGNVVTERNENGPINLTEAGRPGGVNSDDYSVECFGEVLTGVAGNYQFCVDTDDGGYVHVLNSDNGTWYAMLDRDTHGQGTWRCTNNVPLSAAKWYELRAGYWEEGSGSGMKVGWLTPGAGGVVSIPGANLRAEDGFLRAHLEIQRFSSLTNNCSGFTCDYEEWMWGIALGEPGGMWWWEGMFDYCDSACAHTINTIGNGNPNWDPADYSMVRYGRSKQRSFVFVNMLDDDPILNGSDCGHVWYVASTSTPVSYLSSGYATTDGCNTSLYRCFPQMLTWGAYYNDGEPDDRICVDDDGIAEAGSVCNSGNAHFRAWYTDTTAPPVPSAPAAADSDAPLARAGYDNDLNLTASWTEVDDVNSGTSDYEIEIRQSADATCDAADTLLTTLTATDLDACTSTNNTRTSTASTAGGNYYCARVRARNGGCIDLVTGAPSDGRTWSGWSGFSSAVRVDVRHPVGLGVVPVVGFVPYATYANGVLRCAARNRSSSNQDEQNFDGALVGSCDLSAPISYDYGSGGVTCGGTSAVNYFNVECQGEVQASGTGTYTFGLNSDDGGFVVVNTTTVVRDQGYHGWNGAGGGYSASGTIALTAGTWYPIHAGFFDAGGSAAWELKWTPPGGGMANIPAGNLRKVNAYWARSSDTITFDAVTQDVHSAAYFQNIVLSKTNAPACTGWSWHDWTGNGTNATNDGDCSSYITFPATGSEIKEASEGGGTTYVFRYTPDLLVASNGADFDLKTRVMDLAGDWSTDCATTPSNDTCDVDTGKDLRIDDTSPTCSTSSITEGSNPAYQYANGTTIYYNSAVSGSFTVDATASDARSGMQKVNFPTIGNFTGGGDDASPPYATTYTWYTSSTASGAQTNTAYDNVNNTGTCTFTVTRDVTAPSGGSVSYTDGYYTTALVAVSFVNGTDSGAGIGSRVIERRSATLSNGSCGSYAGWSGIVTDPAASPYSDSGVITGNCYQYRYVVTDNVSNSVTYTSGNTAKVDTTAPSAPTGLMVTNSGNRTLKVTWTNGSDPESGILKHKVHRPAGSVLVDGGTSPCYDDGDVVETCADTGTNNLGEGTQYCYTVRAVNNAGTEEQNAIQVCATAVKANETVAGTVVGYPASAFNGSSQYEGTYVAANSTWLYLLDANGGEVDQVNLGAGNTIAGVPASVWDGTQNVVYVATASGRLFKLKNVDGNPLGDPAGNELCDVTDGPGCTFDGPEHKLVDVCTDGSPAPTQLTTRPIGDANAMWMTAVDADCPTPDRLVAVETTADSVSVNGTVDVVADVGVCAQTQIQSTPKVVTGSGWSATQVHMGSDCVAAATLYRIDADLGNSDCSKDLLGTGLRGWITGSFGRLYVGTLGGAPAERGFYVVDKYGGSGVCGTDVYETLAGFPYQGPSTDIGNVSRGASVNWNSEQDEVYFGADDGKLHCVCTTTSVQGGNSCVIAVADRCDGTPGVGQACTGFPVTLQAGVALREPLIKDGTIYIASATGKIYAVEPLCDEGGADGTASGTVKSSNGFTFTLDTTGLDSSVSALDTGGPVQIMVGTNTGRVFYLPTAP